jgi:D-lactate dehydrogenase (cytochrome)
VNEPIDKQSTTPRSKSAAAFVEWRQLFGDRVSNSLAVREHHARDFTHPTAPVPDAVAFPLDVAEVAAAVHICAAHRLPVIAYGAGTSIEGQISAPHGGLCLDLSRMDQVIQVNERDLDITVQPGVTREALNSYVRDLGLFFPLDPGANATLGGMVATRASGTNAVRYGTMRENVLALEVVLADGSVVRTGTRARKSSAGYDLTRLMVGSEGTLGVVTEVTVKLHGLPSAMSAAVCAFDDLDAAVETVIETIQMGVPVARIELLDELSIRAVNAYSKLGLRELPTLFLEFHGSVASVAEQAETVAELARGHGGHGFEWAVQQEERTRLWRARHEAAWASRALAPAARPIPTDVCVPISRLADCIRETHADLEAMQLLGPLGGHVGDGNFHVMVLVDENDTAARARAEVFHERLILRALGMGGTCTGEHGIGTGKQRFLVQEATPVGIDLMRRIKAAFDPQGLMNPGKIFSMV